MDYRFEQVDVFTTTRFAGNPLAVFTDARGINPANMQHIAREMNLSETTFVVPSTRADCAAKYFIYTPEHELPFAGHPTVGTAFVLARSRLVAPASGVINLEAKIGKVPVRLEGPYDSPTALFFTSPSVQFGSRFENRSAVAQALHLHEKDLVPQAPIEEAGCPVMHPYVALQSCEAVDSVGVNSEQLIEALNQTKPHGIYIFAMPEPGRVYARFFFGFGGAGVIEDPATGSAASPLGAYLVRHGKLAGPSPGKFVVEQGTKMGRQSFLSVSVQHNGLETEKIEVGGSAVPVLNGTLTLEEST